MSISLTDFLIDLAQDPQKTEAFKENPRQVMSDAGLSKEDQDLLLSGDPQAISEAVDADRVAEEMSALVFITVLHD
jgi:hypothetical protein